MVRIEKHDFENPASAVLKYNPYPMQILLIRHGTKKRGTRQLWPQWGKEQKAARQREDALLPLNEVGQKECEQLLEELRLLDFKSDIWLSSTYEHSIQTAQLIANGKPSTNSTHSPHIAKLKH